MMHRELFTSCWQCLVTKSANAKLDCVQQLVARWQLRQLLLDHDGPCKQLDQAGIPEAVRLVHPENAEGPIEVSWSGRWSSCSPAQPENAPWPMLVSPVRSLTSLKFAQEAKADFPMLTTPSGRLTLVSCWQ